MWGAPREMAQAADAATSARPRATRLGAIAAWTLLVALIAFAAWALDLVLSMRALRSDVEAHQRWLMSIQAVQAEVHQISIAADDEVQRRGKLTVAVAEITERAPIGDGAARVQVRRASAAAATALNELARAPNTKARQAASRTYLALDALTSLIRAQHAETSALLGRKWNSLALFATAALLFALATYGLALSHQRLLVRRNLLLEELDRERAMREKAALLARASEAMGTGVALLHPDGTIASPNSVFTAMAQPFGSPGSLWKAAARQLRLDDGEICPRCEQKRRNGTHRVELETVSGRKGFEVTFAGHAHDVSKDGREDVLLVADVSARIRAEEEQRLAESERRSLEQQLHLAARLSAVGRLAAGVAHEINNPLTFVTTNLELLGRKLEGLGAQELAQRELHDALAGAERIKVIVRDMRILSRPQRNFSTVDVQATLELALRMTATELYHRCRVVREYGPCPPVEGDATGLGQVFINLLINAARSIREDGAHSNTVTVRTSQTPDGGARIDIQDTGPGIPEDVLPRIFDPFFTTRPQGEGTGLGLSVSHSIVSSMGGQILVDTSNRGATFSVLLPPSRAEARPVAPEAQTPVAERTLRILLVDDEPEIVDALSEILYEHQVTTATDGAQALAHCRQKDFDLILCDLMMPGTNGIDIYEALEADGQGREKAIVVTTGGAFTARARAFLDRFPGRCLEKPFDIATLRALVHDAARNASWDPGGRPCQLPP